MYILSNILTPNNNDDDGYDDDDVGGGNDDDGGDGDIPCYSNIGILDKV
jgi:hypothetical protein